jgi:hypothetical protein
MRTTLRNAKGNSEFSGWPGHTHFIERQTNAPQQLA